MGKHSYIILGGSTKCGTTSVFNYFEFHPEVCLCTMKESRYFWDNAYPLEGKPRDHSRVKHFDELFSHCSEKPVRLEATPDYLYSEKAASDILKTIPDAKLIFILRDPVDRFYSWYRFAMQNGMIPDSTTPDEYASMMEENPGPGVRQYLRTLNQSKYSAYLKTYYSLMDPENILILFYEDLVDDPENLCKQICRFAGIDEHYFDNYTHRIYNPSSVGTHVKAHQNMRRIKRAIRPFTRFIRGGLRKRLKLAGHKIESAFINANAGMRKPTITISPTLRKSLHNFYSADVRELITLTGITPPWKLFQES